MSFIGDDTNKEGVAMRHTQTLEYNNKTYYIPVIDESEGVIEIEPHLVQQLDIPLDSPVVRDLGKPFDVEHFLEARTPVSLGVLSQHDQKLFVTDSDARNVLDLPIKFPYSAILLPQEYAQVSPVVERFADVLDALDPEGYENVYLYLTFRRSRVFKGQQHHPAPVHVDGWQGARWQPKHRANTSITVSNCMKTVYFNQPFDLRSLDPARHDAFWEMNRQVAATNSSYAWTNYNDFEIMMMDSYCPHIAGDATADAERFWVRITAETRVFDRLGNGHNPFFDYDWHMVPRDIEQLHLEAFDKTCDPSLRVFPWQALDGSVNPPGVVTYPNLRPLG